ncbi:hypothetical protein WCE02_17975 [Pseudomonas juntendi]|uniref:Uncharacterized protein n=1 Tax=Pseudomonas putida TaxID=303 RepID=A0A1X0ZQM8_PSEPU|nr:hypothetical protein [Pseudomonas putida]MEB3901605.1 hypothetical protein [Pseudomonas putida]ORL61636.1 hypothetical protein B7H17_20420 [Pseudomonas putida]
MKTDFTNQDENAPFYSGSLEDLLSAIYADGCVSAQEYRAIRDEADKRIETLIGLLGSRNSTLTAYMNSMDVTMQLLQLAALQAKKAKLTDTGKAIVRDALQAQLEYLKAGTHLVLTQL